MTQAPTKPIELIVQHDRKNPTTIYLGQTKQLDLEFTEGELQELGDWFEEWNCTRCDEKTTWVSILDLIVFR